MNNNEVAIGYDIYTKIPKENYTDDDFYEYGETEDGRLYWVHYGCEVEDCYITCFEEVDGDDFTGALPNLKFYYQKTGRLPFQYINKFTWKEVEGLTLCFEKIEDEEKPCFVKYDENKCFILE